MGQGAGRERIALLDGDCAYSGMDGAGSLGI